METFSMFFLLSLFTLLLKLSVSETIVVDGLTKWKNPSVLVGDTIIFKHKQHYNLYIFQNRKAFKLCNFTQAILLTDPISNSFTWHPSRPGFFYFLFNNGSVNTCQENGKLPILVTLQPPESMTPSPELAPQIAPSPTSGGGIVSSSPAKPWNLLSPPQSNSPSPAPRSDKRGGGTGGIPFINSNPAVPLPTDADAATIRPLPMSGNVGQMVGLLSVQIPLFCVVWMMLWS
ncbi:Cupredoxin superfamily protein [Thalictrum thalictroides]|uniref:Cupredoxin superfamily protein n=1 Tax=Thalictrum thalictroides TaxID=46969 RepID=A0A7J6VCW1_THATH|nr:Cupredoxin superfamily protein [Thalictrum thalictroides]